MFRKYNSPLGELLLQLNDCEVLIGAWFTDGRFAPCPDRLSTEELPFAAIKDWLDRYFLGEAPSPEEIRMQLTGSAFQLLVWEELRRIPYGEVTTYGAIAKALEMRLGHRVAAQAVGGAVGRNPISILIPCHRVVGAGGKLTGYGGGLRRKEYLLHLEQKMLDNW